MLSGSFWTISMRWSMKLLGLVSTTILARLILPSEYAVVAMAMIVVSLISALFDFGVEIALIRKPELDDAYINSAWSLRTVEGLLIGSGMALLSPLATIYFHDERVAPVLWVLAFCIALTGTANVGMLLARKNLNFSLEFKVQLTAKVAQVIATLGTAYFVRDYRALVFGIAVSYVVAWLMSYVWHSYRPRWNTSAFMEIWRVTRWLMVSSVLNCLTKRIDEIVAGRIGTSTQFGLYNVGADIGQLPTAEFGPAILKAFYPVLSSIQHDAERVKSGVLKVQAIVTSVTLPAGIGVASVAAPLTLLMLGPNWNGAIPFVRTFGLIGAISVIGIPLATLLVLRGFTRLQTRIIWIEFVVFAIVAVFSVAAFHLQGLAIARLAGGCASVLLLAWECQRKCGLSIRSVARVVWRPFAASLVMGAIAAYVLTLFNNIFIGLGFSILAAALSYTLMMLISWRLLGCPQGLEFEIIGIINRRFGRIPWLSSGV